MNCKSSGETKAKSKFKFMEVLTDSFTLVEPDLVDFFPKSTDLIHFPGDLPIVA